MTRAPSISFRVLTLAVLVGVVWLSLWGVGQLRLSGDPRWCNGNQTCLSLRKSVRWGPYQAFGDSSDRNKGIERKLAEPGMRQVGLIP